LQLANAGVACSPGFEIGSGTGRAIDARSPSTLLYIDGLVDFRAKVEIDVAAFVPVAA
jgi:hypothetical protein